METVNGHHYDSLGICVACERCTDPECCEQVTCDMFVWGPVFRSIEKMVEEARKHGNREDLDS